MDPSVFGFFHNVTNLCQFNDSIIAKYVRSSNTFSLFNTLYQHIVLVKSITMRWMYSAQEKIKLFTDKPILLHVCDHDHQIEYNVSKWMCQLQFVMLTFFIKSSCNILFSCNAKFVFILKLNKIACRHKMREEECKPKCMLQWFWQPFSWNERK